MSSLGFIGSLELAHPIGNLAGRIDQPWQVCCGDAFVRTAVHSADGATSVVAELISYASDDVTGSVKIVEKSECQLLQ